MPRKITSETPAAARRKPAQSRALKTQELIFETATRLLEQEGLAAFNTNRLAELSGFSVGTIYQYFGNKQDVLVALGRRESDLAMAALQRHMVEHARQLTDVDPVVRIRTVLRIMLGAFGGRLQARRILVDAAIKAGRTEILDRPVAAVAAVLSGPGIPRPGGGVLRLTSDEAFVLTESVIGAVRTALLREPSRLKKPSFEDALVRLVAGFLLPQSGHPGPG